MIMSTLDPKTLVESLEKEELVLMPLAEYQALLARLEELQDARDQLQAELIELGTIRLRQITDQQASLNPVSLEGIWRSIVVDDEDFEAARRSLFKPIHDEEL
jgi:hypothetical protein